MNKEEKDLSVISFLPLSIHDKFDKQHFVNIIKKDYDACNALYIVHLYIVKSTTIMKWYFILIKKNYLKKMLST